MEKHQQISAWIHVVFNGIGLLSMIVFALFVAGMFGTFAYNDLAGEQSWMFGLIGSMGVLLVGLFSILFIVGLIGAYGVLKFKPYGKPILLAISVLYLFSFPFGTAAGAYTLWAFLAKEQKGQNLSAGV